MTFSSHKGVIGAFGEQFIKTDAFPRESGRELNKAFEKRQLGDYESTSAVSEEDAQGILTHAKEFCDEVGQWLGESRR